MTTTTLPALVASIIEDRMREAQDERRTRVVRHRLGDGSDAPVVQMPRHRLRAAVALGRGAPL